MSSQDHSHDNWFSHEIAEVPQAEHAHVVNTVTLFKWFLATIVFLAVVIASLFAYFDSYVARLRSGQIMKADGTPVPGYEILLSAESNAAKAAADETLGIKDGKLTSGGAMDQAYGKVLGTYGK
ncbi:MAG: hypothetical protein ACOYN0_00300 [Phycisphaerales bacterium]